MLVTNTRDSTIKVTKVLVPATDGGKFNLLIDGQAKATNVGDGGTTGVRRSRPAPTRWASPRHGTDLANYDSTTSCVDKAHAAKPADTDGSVHVAAGDQWECVITNTRKSTPPPPRRAADRPAAGRRRPPTRPSARRSASAPHACAPAARG